MEMTNYLIQLHQNHMGMEIKMDMILNKKKKLMMKMKMMMRVVVVTLQIFNFVNMYHNI